MAKLPKDGDILHIDGEFSVVRRLELKLEYFEVWVGDELKFTCWSEEKGRHLCESMKQGRSTNVI